jgi:hypothetical protein
VNKDDRVERLHETSQRESERWRRLPAVVDELLRSGARS